MANISASYDRGGASGLRDFLRRRLNEAAGFGLFMVSLVLALVLASYDHADPSLDVASDAAPVNIGGATGAIAADILFQAIGLAACLIPVVLIVWALRLLLNQPIGRIALRLAILPLMLASAAVALGAVPAAEGALGLHAGFGGTLGRLVYRLTETRLVGVPLWGVGPLPSLVALAACLLAVLLAWFVLDLGGAAHAAAFGGFRLAALGVAEAGAILLRLPAGMRFLGRLFEGADPMEPVAPIRQAPRFADSAAPQTEAAPASPPQPSIRRGLRRAIVAPKAQGPAPGRRAEEVRQPSLDLEPVSTYQLPSLAALAQPAAQRARGPSEEALQQNALLLLGVLEDFGVNGEIVKVRPGPVVTLYELEPAPGTKSSRVIGLADDIARSMSAVSVRVAVVPGRNVIGIELPNAQSETVYLRELLAAEAYERASSPLTLVLGKDIGGAPVLADLAKMPHLLIAGTTGSGKSVGINTMILSLLYRLPPDRCKFIMIDPKMLELSIYDGIPHLLAPVVTDPKKAVVALKWTVREMEQRYRQMSKLGVRNIDGFNARLAEAMARGESLSRRVQTGFDPETGEPQFEEQPLDCKPLPFIVVVVDEMADLMLVAGKDIEAAVQRLAQMARAAGIHIIMATQRPSVDVITGTIKANFPTRISFQVTSKIDSRTILGESGAEQLLGRGDMLHMSGGGRIARVHGPFVSDGEVEAVVNFLKTQGAPDYVEDVTEEDEEAPSYGASEEGDDGANELYDRAVALVCRERKASTSFVQRHLQIGYNRAARIMEKMEREGVVSQANHVGKREVLAPPGR